MKTCWKTVSERNPSRLFKAHTALLLMAAAIPTTFLTSNAQTVPSEFFQADTVKTYIDKGIDAAIPLSVPPSGGMLPPPMCQDSFSQSSVSVKFVHLPWYCNGGIEERGMVEFDLNDVLAQFKAHFPGVSLPLGPGSTVPGDDEIRLFLEVAGIQNQTPVTDPVVQSHLHAHIYLQTTLPDYDPNDYFENSLAYAVPFSNILHPVNQLHPEIKIGHALTLALSDAVAYNNVSSPANQIKTLGINLSFNPAPWGTPPVAMMLGYHSANLPQLRFKP